MSVTTNHQRKQYLINPGFQWKIAGTIAAGVFVLSIIIGITLYGTLHQQARLRAADPAGYVAPVTSVMVCFALGFAALSAGGVGLWSILMTHRICGPIFVMKRYLLELAQGRIPSLRPLRKRDEFKDLYEAFDQAISSLRTARQRELVQLGTALEAIREWQNAGPAHAADKVAPIIERIESLRVRAQESLSDCKPGNVAATTSSAVPQLARHPA
jgi:methyl-accepting chemotaxis protein